MRFSLLSAFSSNSRSLCITAGMIFLVIATVTPATTGSFGPAEPDIEAEDYRRYLEYRKMYEDEEVAFRRFYDDFGPKDSDLEAGDYRRYLEYRRKYELKQEDEYETGDWRDRQRHREEPSEDEGRLDEIDYMFVGYGREGTDGIVSLGAYEFPKPGTSGELYKGVSLYFIDNRTRPSNYEDAAIPHQDYTVVDEYKDHVHHGEFGAVGHTGITFTPDNTFFGGILWGISTHTEATLVESNETGKKWLEDDPDQKWRLLGGVELGFQTKNVRMAVSRTNRYEFITTLSYAF